MPEPVSTTPRRRGLVIGLAVLLLAGVVGLTFLCFPELRELGKKPEPQNFTISQWHTTVDLRDDDGTAAAAFDHDAVIVFPETDENTGLKFTVPLQNGSRTVTLSDVAVTDANGTPLPFTERQRDGIVTLRITNGNFVHGEQHLHIRYTVHHPILAEDGADVFDTDLWTGALPSAVEDFSARVQLDERLGGALLPGAACLLSSNGTSGSAPSGSAPSASAPSDSAPSGSSCEVAVVNSALGTTLTLQTPGRIPANSVLHVSLPFAPGTVTQPSAVQLWTASDWGLAIGGSLLSLLALVIIVLSTRRGLRRLPPRSRALVADADAVPPVAESALLLEGSNGERAFAAGVLELAERGALTIDSPNGNAKETTLSRAETTTELPASAQRLLDTVLFPNGATTLRPAHDRDLAARYGTFIDETRHEMEAAGTLVPNRTPGYLWALLALAVVSLVPLSSAAWTSAGRESGTTFWPMACFIFAIVLLVMAGASFVIWGTGLSARRDNPQVQSLLAMRNYVKASEAEREAFRAQTHPVDDERLLPYAMLFGEQDRWEKMLGDPVAGSWRSDATLATSLLPMIVTMNTMLMTTGATTTSSPSTSSMGGQAGGL